MIVQDLGLARLIQRLAPGLVVHGSTQMTLTDSRGVEFVRGLGVERVILARELSLKDISLIRQETSLPLEVFVHGALCVAYSGQCLTSESLGGRSANRGQCAQACRLPYDLILDGEDHPLGDVAYLLSPQDLAAPDLISEMTELGVACFKIEGRLKSAEYVAATTQTYRAALDAALSQTPFEVTQEQQNALTLSFSRGFTPGFLNGVNHQELVQGRFPKSRGAKLGRLVEIRQQRAVLELDPVWAETAQLPIRPGDGVVFDEGHPDQDEQGGRVYEVHPLPHKNGEPQHVELVFGTGAVNLSALNRGCLVWKTDDPQLRRRLEQSYRRDVVANRIPITARVEVVVGEPLRLSFADETGHQVSVQSPAPLEAARQHPLSYAVLTEQLGRLGDTPFEMKSVVLSHGSTRIPEGETAPVMVPKSVLNELRRQAIQQLQERRKPCRNRDLHPQALVEMRKEIHCRWETDSTQAPDAESRLTVLARSMEQVEAIITWEPPSGLSKPVWIYCDFEDVRRYPVAVEMCRQAGRQIALATLRITKPQEDGWLRQIGLAQPDGVLLRNLSSLRFFQENFPEITRLGDYSLNVANELTASLFLEQGLIRLTPSYDLNWQQLSEMLEKIPGNWFEIVVHQHMPMFHMEHCVFAHTLSEGKDYRDCGRPCEHHRVELKDRVGEVHPLVADVGCRNTLFNAHAQSATEYIPRMRECGVRHFRVELLREKSPEVGPLLESYARVAAGLEDGRATWKQLRVLHHFGVTRGPLDFS